MTKPRDPSTHIPRNRARLVCMNCHARKVKCNLQAQPDNGSCSSCRKHGLECRTRPTKRVTVRQKYAQRQLSLLSPESIPSSSRLASASASDLPPASLRGDVDGPQSSATATSINIAIPTSRGDTSTTPLHSQYLGDAASIFHNEPGNSSDHDWTTMLPFSAIMNKEMLRISGATDPPPQYCLSAYADIYFQHAFHRLPVLDRMDIFGDHPSIILCQAVCMLGFMLKQPATGTALPMAEADKYYFRVKTLIYAEYEHNPIRILQALCFLSYWNAAGMRAPTTNSGWHWLGVAVYIMHQVGLHRETVCANRPRAGLSRRIAWYIWAQDKILSAALGRPTSLRLGDFDVRPLAVEDFEIFDTSASIFMQIVQLAMILGRILDLRSNPSEDLQAEHQSILDSLQNWIHTLPEDIRIHESNNLPVYSRQIYELHIIYLVIIINYFNLFGDRTVHSLPSLATLVASSCITRLYQQMECRDDLKYLYGIHSWYLTMASLPQLLWSSTEDTLKQTSSCSEELDILVSVIEQRQIMNPGCRTALKTIRRLRTPQGQSILWTDRGVGEPQRNTFVCEGDYLLHAIRNLFPFPSSLSLRLTLLESAAEDFAIEQSRIPVVVDSTYDFSSFSFEDFSDIPDLSNTLSLDAMYAFGQEF